MSNTERKPRQTNYQTFYKDAIDKKEGYVTKDGSWAAIQLHNSKRFGIIHNGQQVHTCRNYDYAKAYILKNSKRKNGK
tara:strand:+ start:12519 stop:12752 length:234 start_codon:yes stop_codon:yes gene_type:complete